MDYFNEILIPDIGMSGGYGLFSPNGRLPAHLHDFVESISIIEGEATCFVEGKRYKISKENVATQPRGRIHYFVNNTDKTRSMIWVYTEPTPDRIEVADQLATEGLL